MKKLSPDKWKTINDVLQVDSLIAPLTSRLFVDELNLPTVDSRVRERAQEKLSAALKGSVSDDQMNQLNQQGITRLELMETGRFSDYGRPNALLEFSPMELHMELFNRMQASLQKPSVRRGVA